MICLLGFLTCINLFIYNNNTKPDQSVSLVQTEEEGTVPGDTNVNQPAGPDEKSPDRSVSVSEEYVHELHEGSALRIEKLIHTLLSVDKKISPVHFELITPPPDAAV